MLACWLVRGSVHLVIAVIPFEVYAAMYWLESLKSSSSGKRGGCHDRVTPMLSLEVLRCPIHRDNDSHWIREPPASNVNPYLRVIRWADSQSYTDRTKCFPFRDLLVM